MILVSGLLLPLLAAQAPKSHYMGEETREIKSLSSKEIMMYLHGAGMGLAKAAELNQYPGPMHVLELAEQLDLSQDQREQTVALFTETKGAARRIGEEVVELERELDQLFSSGRISEEDLSRLLGEIGAKKTELRLVHLRAHLRQRSILTADQTARYVSLRGYESGQ
jgi:Spy/CpxP family protein refolding chaperone